MAVRAYNKVTGFWVSTEDGSELTPPGDWIVNPTFTDEAFAMQIGREYWTFNGTTIETPTPVAYAALQVASQRAQKWELIKAERSRRLYVVGVTVGADTFFTDPDSRTQYLAMHALGSALPSGIAFKTVAGGFVVVTPSFVKDIVEAIAAMDKALFAYGEQLKAALDVSSTPGRL